MGNEDGQLSYKMRYVLQTMLDSVITFWSFIGFVLCIPTFFFNYIGVQVCRYLWFKILNGRLSNLELVRNTTARTAMDTHRNQGIITVLLQVKGQCDINLIKHQILEEVVEKTNKDGSLRFPHMKMVLTSYWWRYAWITDTEYFNIDNHVKHETNPMFRNRIVTSSNIQEYISDAITKYMPPWNKNPPWELRIITTEQDRFYILARLHHLYISEDGISFGDLLMIKPDYPIPADKKDMDSIEQIVATIYRKPTEIPTLYKRTRYRLSNVWNETLLLYDPLEDPSVVKDSPTIIEFICIVFIAFISSVRERYKSRQNLFTIFRNKASERELSVRLFFASLLNTVYPHIFISRLVICIRLIITSVLQFPLIILQFIFSSSLYRAVGEVFYLFKLLYISPKVLIEELVLPIFRRPKHHLQKISLSGRKVVSWTDSIPIKNIKSIRDKTGAASCEIQLYGVAAALHEYFQKSKLLEPDTILTTTRFIPEENLLKSSNQISSGLLCLPLPVNTIPSDDPLFGLHLVQLAVQNALTTQTALYMSSLWQYDYGILTTILPSIVVRFILNILSRRYPVMMTQIEAHNKELQKRNLVWGQQVEAFFYWRPPQANISMSLSLISYGDEMRFAVMADAELAPDYNIIISEYVSRINQLAQDAENYPTIEDTSTEKFITY